MLPRHPDRPQFPISDAVVDAELAEIAKKYREANPCDLVPVLADKFMDLVGIQQGLESSDLAARFAELGRLVACFKKRSEGSTCRRTLQGWLDDSVDLTQYFEIRLRQLASAEQCQECMKAYEDGFRAGLGLRNYRDVIPLIGDLLSQANDKNP